MRTFLSILSGLIIVAGVVPYILDVLKRQTKPRIVSWFNWTLLTGIAAAASLADKQYASAALTLAATIATALVVIFGLRYGDRKFEAFDIYCELGALLGLILWIIFNSPLVAIAATVSIDFIAALPTLKHSWQKPYEETRLAYISGVAGGFLALAAVNKPHLSGLLYPVYIPLANLALVLLISFSPHKKDA
jgi:hypothetical protein